MKKMRRSGSQQVQMVSTILLNMVGSGSSGGGGSRDCWLACRQAEAARCNRKAMLEKNYAVQKFSYEGSSLTASNSTEELAACITCFASSHADASKFLKNRVKGTSPPVCPRKFDTCTDCADCRYVATHTWVSARIYEMPCP
jgi:hypothetical protein